MSEKEKSHYAYKLENCTHHLEVAGLGAIVFITTLKAAETMFQMVIHAEIKLEDILMMFIYLEIIAMAGIYLKSGKLPIRMPIYIGIVALTRYLIIESKSLTVEEILAISSGVVLLSIAVLVIKFAQKKYSIE